MARLSEKPMARAQAHLAAGRYAEAVGGFRATLWIDPTLVGAHVGLAHALAGRGRRGEAVTGLVAAAEACAGSRRPTDALCLYATALSLEPTRDDLHLDIATVEESMGRHDAAVERIEALAERYFDAGRTEEAIEVLRFMSSWTAAEPSRPIATAVEAPAASSETVICATVLLRPDGTLMKAAPAPSPEPTCDDPTLRRRPPARPMARRPAPQPRRAATPPPVPSSRPKVGARLPAAPSRPISASRSASGPLRLPSRTRAASRVASGPSRAAKGPSAPRRDVGSSAVTRRPTARVATPAKPSALAERLRQRASMEPGAKRRARPVEARVRPAYPDAQAPIDEDAITLCFRRSDLIKTAAV
ncbi:MAG: hypothetical protein AAF799_30490 [Myxococcota bacterium]